MMMVMAMAVVALRLVLRWGETLVHCVAAAVAALHLFYHFGDMIIYVRCVEAGDHRQLSTFIRQRPNGEVNK